MVTVKFHVLTRWRRCCSFSCSARSRDICKACSFSRRLCMSSRACARHWVSSVNKHKCIQINQLSFTMSKFYSLNIKYINVGIRNLSGSYTVVNIKKINSLHQRHSPVLRACASAACLRTVGVFLPLFGPGDSSAGVTQGLSRGSEGFSTSYDWFKGAAGVRRLGANSVTPAMKRGRRSWLRSMRSAPEW